MLLHLEIILMIYTNFCNVINLKFRIFSLLYDVYLVYYMMYITAVK